jgi:tagatose 1,6-diphosphate aldolase
MPESFVFQDPPELQEGDLSLRLIARQPAAESLWQVPAYIFRMRLAPNEIPVGRISFRAEDSEWVVRYAGHIGYSVEEPYRGRRYAERSCRLLLPFVRLHRRQIWITCGPDNLASRRTIERLGAEFVETVDVPPEYPMPEDAIRQKCRYLLKL